MMRNWVAFFLCFLVPFPVLAELRVTDLTGKVAVVPEGAKEASPALANMPLTAGDHIITGAEGRVEISDRNGSIFELKAKSSLLIKKYDEKFRVIELKAGQTITRIVRKEAQTFKIQSPMMVASVKGTDVVFLVEDDGATQAAIAEGTVVFSPNLKGDPRTNKLWPKRPIPVKKDEGMIARPFAAPVKTSQIPPVMVASLDWFKELEARTPQLEEQWNNWDKAESLKLREDTFKDAIQWKIPRKIFP